MRRAQIRRLIEELHGAAFVTDEDGEIVAWGEGATQLLGHDASSTVGRPCFEVLEGLDAFGNRYCVPDCPILQACRMGAPLRPHELALRRADGTLARTFCVPTRVTVEGAPGLLYLLFEHSPFAPPPAPPSPPPPCRRGPAHAPSPLSRLSAREREVLIHLADGLAAPDIASTLSIRETTVRNHVQAVLRKLGVHSKLEAVVLAFKHGLVTCGDES